jgi:hypothetical protein
LAAVENRKSFMPHVWIKENETWRAVMISSGELALTPALLAGLEPGSAPAQGCPRIKQFANPEASEEWLLIAPPRSVRINGILDPLGCRLLRDRDELQIPGFQPIYFSTELLPKIEDFAGGDHPVHCPRCRDLVERGSPSVQCPHCRTFYHQRADSKCWSYCQTCILCGQPTALTGAYRWSPEEVGS